MAGGYLLLDGVNGSYARAPDAAAFDDPGSFDLRADVYPNVVNLTQYLASRFSSDFLWRLGLSNTSLFGRLRDAAATTENISMGSLITDSTRWQMRFVIDVGVPEARAYLRANPAGSIDLSSDVGWSAVVGSPDGMTITDIREGVDPFTIGASNTGGVWDGRIYRLQYYHGTSASGTLIVDANPEDETTWAPDAGSFTDNVAGYVFTLNGNAELVPGPSELATRVIRSPRYGVTRMARR